MLCVVMHGADGWTGKDEQADEKGDGATEKVVTLPMACTA